jgi:hypothetical protein
VSLLGRRQVLKWPIVSLAVLGVLVVGLFGACRFWFRYKYPYGCTHCCLKGLGLALLNYAEQHNGRFPAGGDCPEASLSLLYRGDYGIEGHTLCGKTKSAEVAQAILERGELLGPDTCDWHYVEGLTLNDDCRLAIVWDKVGLDHNGGRLPSGGHSVLRLDCSEEVIPASEWPHFLEKQNQLMSARTESARIGLPILTATIRLPSGDIVDHYDGSYSLSLLNKTYEGASSINSESSSGGKLGASMLQWRKLPNGVYTFELSLNGWKSKPVEVNVSNGIATPSSILFEMERNGG